MKTIIFAAALLLLSGCAGMDGNKFMQGFGAGMEQQAQRAQQNQQNLQAYQKANPVKQTDYQCLQSCTQAGYQYGLCNSKCSY